MLKSLETEPDLEAAASPPRPVCTPPAQGSLEAAAAPPPVPARFVRRGSLVGEARFALDFLRLCVALFAEFAHGVASFTLFLLGKRRQRERVRRIMFHGRTPLVAITLGAALGLLGCASTGRGGPGSFERQVRETGWSVRTIADMSDARRSLEEELESFGSDPHWLRNLHFDASHLFLSPDAGRSLEGDLQALGDPDWRRHGVLESLRLFGW